MKWNKPLTRYKKKVIRRNALILAREFFNILAATALTANHLLFLSVGWTGCFFTDLFKTSYLHMVSVSLFLVLLTLLPCLYIRWIAKRFSRQSLILTTQGMGIFLDCLRLLVFAIAILSGWFLAYLIFPYPINTFVITVFLVHVVGLMTLYGFSSIIRQLLHYKLIK